MKLKLQSIGTLVGFDARLAERGGIDSSGKIIKPKEKGADKDSLLGISNHGGFVTKPVEAFLDMIASQYNGNNLSALHFYLAGPNYDLDRVNAKHYTMMAQDIKNHVGIKADIVSTHPHLYLRDANGNPVPMPNNIAHNGPWCDVLSHTSTSSSGGSIGRVVRNVAYYHQPWEFLVDFEIVEDERTGPLPTFLSEAVVVSLFVLAGQKIGVGAGRTQGSLYRKTSGALNHPKGRFRVEVAKEVTCS